MDFASVKVLVVDDEETIRETLVESLETMGFENVRTAANGEEALERLGAEKVDLLLLDLAMPKIRGEEVVELALGRDPDLVIVVVTGFATLEKAINLMKCGIYDLLRKPFNPRMLAKKVESALLKREARRREEAPGRAFGDFELLEEISQGGSSTVWRARETATAEEVALKILLAGKTATDEQIMRFHREAQTITELRHPHIVGIRRIGAHKDQHFIAMDLIRGLPMDEWIERNDPPLREVIAILCRVGMALDYAHQREILHRDLKPSNILVDENRQPHIIDFGLAKSIREGLRITRKSRLLGTIGYISPERFSDKSGAVGVEADIFALGVILYEILTGTLPYRILKECNFLPDFTHPPTAPAAFRPGLPAGLSDATLKAVALKPEDRFHSAREFANALNKSCENL